MLAETNISPRSENRKRRHRKTASDHLREALQNLAYDKVRIATHKETAWASITFAGTRHRLDLLFDGPDAVQAGEHFLAELPDHEFSIPRQLVADANVLEVDHRMTPRPTMAVTIELLLLEDS